MAGAGPPALELTAETVAHIRATTGLGPSMATAHQQLTRLRAEHNSDTTEYVDLTHVTHADLFDWRLWFACRPDWDMVVGTGAWAFRFVRVCSRDTNLLDYRGDLCGASTSIDRGRACACARSKPGSPKQEP